MRFGGPFLLKCGLIIKHSNLQKLRDSLETPYQPKQPIPTKRSSLDASFLFLGSPQPSQRISSLHPHPVQIFKLWQAFLDNVNPLSKVIHAPTVQVQILQATGNLDNLQSNTEALLFAIYTTAICSLSSDECESIMGEPKTNLSPRFLTATEQALSIWCFCRPLYCCWYFKPYFELLNYIPNPLKKLILLSTDSNEAKVQPTLAMGFDRCCNSDWPKNGTILRWQVAWLVNI